ncbi:MAG: YbjN domain-containing protein [Marinomonas sp.]
MNPVQDTYFEEETAAPVEMLAALFEARGWPCEVTPQGEVTSEVQGSWSKYQLRGIWRPEDKVLQLMCFPDIHLSEPKRAATYELLSLINEQIWLGHFDIWSSGDVLLYRHGAMIGGEGTLSLDQAQAVVETAIDECDRFYPAFQFVLWGDKDPRDALTSAMVDAAGEA